MDNEKNDKITGLPIMLKDHSVNTFKLCIHHRIKISKPCHLKYPICFKKIKIHLTNHCMTSCNK